VATVTVGTALYAGLVLFIAYAVRGMAGFGSGLIAVPLLSMVAPVASVVPMVVALDYMGSASQGLGSQKQIAWRELSILVPFMIVGVAGGLYFLSVLPTAILSRALGAFVLTFAVYQLLPLPPMRGSRLTASYFGLLGGLVGTLFGTGGPFYAIYLSLCGLGKESFRATFATNFLLDGGVRLVAYTVLGLFTRDLLLALASAVPVAAVGLWVGSRIHSELSPLAFRAIISALLVGSGLVLLFRT
jgi:uncharacterized protein